MSQLVPTFPVWNRTTGEQAVADATCFDEAAYSLEPVLAPAKSDEPADEIVESASDTSTPEEM